MNINEIKKLLETPEYEFIKSNPHLGKNIIFLTLGGSHAYGTNVESSDIDMRGVTLNAPSDLIGLTTFEQVINSDTDTTVYTFKKAIELFMNCNPNSIEMLGCKPEHYLILSNIGKELIKNRKMFLSKRAIHSFGGYATAQLRRLENALCHDAMDEDRKKFHILNSLNSALYAFQSRYKHFKFGSIELFTDKKTDEELASDLEDTSTVDLYANISLERFPLGEFNGMINEIKEVLSSYRRLNGRNKKKDIQHLNKHAMHLVRLYLMAFDILEKEEIITYRENEHDMLMEIRNGKYSNPDGSYQDEFFDIVNEFEKRLEYAKNNTNLPEQPDLNVIQNFVMDINRRTINENY